MEKHSNLKNKKRKKQKQKQKNKTGTILSHFPLFGGGLIVMDIDNSVGILLHGLIKNNPQKLTRVDT